MRKIVVVLGVLAAIVAGAQTTVKADQGKPGNQGAWPVTLSGSNTTNVAFDGGYIGTVATQPCSTFVQSLTDAGTAAVTVPPSPLANRAWIQICNSLLNANGSQCICEGDGKPTYSAGSIGDVLATGDCATYNIGTKDGGVPWCICSAANISLSATECVP